MELIWSSNQSTDQLANAFLADKKDELEFLGYSREMIDELDLEEIDQLIADENDLFASDLEDFEFALAPEIAKQVRNGLIIDQEFNLIPPQNLVNQIIYSAEMFKDENGGLYFKFAGRKESPIFPILGFSLDDEEFINQLEELGILDDLRNLYPDHEDLDFDDIYYYGDMIPFDFELLNKVLTHPTLDRSLDEEVKLDEASTKDPEGLAKELKELKELSNEYGREYFTNMPFTSYDNDPMSIEVQYPEFFKIVKSFFKEMGVLTKDQLNDPDILDMSWDEDISQHDWNTLMTVCDKLVAKGGKPEQIEKIYKNNFDDGLNDEEILASRE